MTDLQSRAERVLLLVWVHGFKGNQATFHSFPQDVSCALTDSYPERKIVSTIYPKYRTVGELAAATESFVSWLKSYHDEVSKGGSAPAAHSAKPILILLGHSMGGMLVADAARSLRDAQRSDPACPRVDGVIALDTPYLGIHPALVSYGMEQLDAYVEQTLLSTAAFFDSSPRLVKKAFSKIGIKRSNLQPGDGVAPSGRIDPEGRISRGAQSVLGVPGEAASVVWDWARKEDGEMGWVGLRRVWDRTSEEGVQGESEEMRREREERRVRRAEEKRVTEEEKRAKKEEKEKEKKAKKEEKEKEKKAKKEEKEKEKREKEEEKERKRRVKSGEDESGRTGADDEEEVAVQVMGEVEGTAESAEPEAANGESPKPVQRQDSGASEDNGHDAGDADAKQMPSSASQSQVPPPKPAPPVLQVQTAGNMPSSDLTRTSNTGSSPSTPKPPPGQGNDIATPTTSATRSLSPALLSPALSPSTSTASSSLSPVTSLSRVPPPLPPRSPRSSMASTSRASFDSASSATSQSSFTEMDRAMAAASLEVAGQKEPDGQQADPPVPPLPPRASARAGSSSTGLQATMEEKKKQKRNWKWVREHMAFVHSLWDVGEITRRMRSVDAMQREGMYFVNIYTIVPPKPPMYPRPRSFNSLPTVHHLTKDAWRPFTHPNAGDQVEAHTALFTEDTNDGYEDFLVMVLDEVGKVIVAAESDTQRGSGGTASG